MAGSHGEASVKGVSFSSQSPFGACGGWFHFGDHGVLHPDRYIQLKDRSKDRRHARPAGRARRPWRRHSGPRRRAGGPEGHPQTLAMAASCLRRWRLCRTEAEGRADDMALAAHDLLAGIKAPDPAAFGGLDRLASLFGGLKSSAS